MVGDTGRHGRLQWQISAKRRTMSYMRIELLTAPGCPNAEPTKVMLTDCLDALGLDVPIIHRVGRYPSPTVIIDGRDVMRAESGPPTGDACRLDLPDPGRLRDALQALRGST